MSQQERAQLIQDFNIRLAAQAELMAEGRPHSRAKSKALDKLSQFFSRVGRRIYLAEEMAVLYPGQRAMVPDIMAVLDVDDPGDEDTRSAWVVADEGKGLDWVLEVYYSGDWDKDFVTNVEDYAQRGIPEYFVYDRRRQFLYGYRLPSPGAHRYQEIRQRFGRYTSQVLELDLQVVEGRLRFFHGTAELFDSQELIGRLDAMVEDLQRRREQAEQEAKKADQRVHEVAEQGLAQLRQSILDILAARGVPTSEPVRIAIAACQDRDALGRWVVRAAVVPTDADVIA